MSTANLYATQTPNTHSARASTLQNFMSMFSIQNSQLMQFPGALQTSFPYSPPPQGMGAPYTFSQQTRAHMNFRPDWATKLIETVNAMSKELGKLNTIEKKKTLSGVQTSVQNQMSRSWMVSLKTVKSHATF